MKFLHDIQAHQVSDDLTSEMALILVNKIVKKRNLGDLYLKGLTMNMPNIFNPVTATATPAASTLTYSLANQTAKSVFAAPIANNGTPTFRALTLADVQDFYTSVDKTQLNYWTLTGSDVYRATGNVYIGHSSSLGAYKLQVTGNSIFEGNVTINGTGSNAAFGVYVGGTTLLELNNTQVYTEKQIYSLPLDGSPTLLKTINGVITRATSAEIADLLGAASNDYIKNQNSISQSANFRINGIGTLGGSLWVGEEVGAFEASLHIGNSRTANGYAYIDLVGDTTYTDYGLRIIRNNAGPNTNSTIEHRGTGALILYTTDSGGINHQVGGNVTYVSSTYSNAHYANVHAFHNVGFNGTQGFVYVTPGNTTNAGYIAIYNSAQIRLGYIGYNNSQLTYVSEGTANHVFLGNKVLIGSGAIYTGSILQVDGSITQRSIYNSVMYADASGQLVTATAQNIRDVLGTASYILNQITSAQTGNFWISGKGRTSGLTIDVNANNYAEVYFRKAGVLQFNLYSYTDSPNNLYLASYNDTGGYITNIFTANRLNGNISFTNNVGIGTINPQYKLDVNGIGRFITELIVESSTTSNSARICLFQTGSNWWYIENVFPGHLKFTRGATDHAMFNNDGKFLVGTTSVYNGSLVQINGSITQRGVLGKMLYADSTGQLIEATASHIAATLGAENYIQNQNTYNQTASFNISGIGVFNGAIPLQFNNAGYQDIHSNSNGIIRIINTPYNASNVEFYQDGTTYFRAGIGVGVGSVPTSRLRVDAADNIWTLQMVKAGAHFGGIHANANSMTFELAGAHHYAFNSNAAERMRIATTGNVLIGASGEYGSYKLQVTGDVFIKDSYLHIDSPSPTIRFRDPDNRGAYIHVNSSIFYILRMNDSGTTWQTNSSGYWPMELNIENNNVFFGGQVRQNFVFNSLVYANSIGTLANATAQNVRDLLGDGSYIQNQFAAPQEANLWIRYSARIGSYAPPGSQFPRFSVSGSHTDTNFSLYSVGDGGGTGNDVSLDMWASEPGLTFDGAGIGCNVNNSPYYGRRNTSKAQSYIRFVAGNIYFSSSTTERLNPVNSPMILSNTERLLIGYGTDVNTYKVQINSGSTSGNGLYVNGNINATGNIIADGYFSGTSSDMRLKSDFKKFTVIDKIDQIEVFSYKHQYYKNGRQIGSSAQQLQKLFPEIISKDSKGFLRVSDYGYSAIVLQLSKDIIAEMRAKDAALWEQTNKHTEEIEKLTLRLRSVTVKLRSANTKIKRLEKRITK